MLPLATATGAGAGSQNAIGTGVLGGTIFATALGIFFVPLFYVVIKRIFRDKPKGAGCFRAAARWGCAMTPLRTSTIIFGPAGRRLHHAHT